MMTPRGLTVDRCNFGSSDRVTSGFCRVLKVCMLFSFVQLKPTAEY